MRTCDLPCGCKIGCKGEGNNTRAFISYYNGEDVLGHNEDYHAAIMDLIWNIQAAYKAKQPVPSAEQINQAR